MKSIFDNDTYAEVLKRISDLDPGGGSRQWGKMDVAQMLCHCKFPLEVALGKMKLKKPNYAMRLLLRTFKKALYNDIPWKQSLQTPNQFRVTDSKEFENEKTKLIALINEFHDEKHRKSWDPHPAFGTFTLHQWGQMQYKHLDHHLRQFGV